MLTKVIFVVTGLDQQGKAMRLKFLAHFEECLSVGATDIDTALSNEL